MSDPLAVYLHDHLSGADFAMDLLQAMNDRKQAGLGQFGESLLSQVKEDRDLLQHLADEIGSGSNVVKEFAAWLGEKASRAKLGAGAAGEFGTFEALEFLALGVSGKIALWRALQVAAPSDARLDRLDFAELISRAEAQFAKIEERRLAAAATALKTAIS